MTVAPQAAPAPASTDWVPIWGLGGVSSQSYGTSLPASPTDGQEYTLVDSVSAPTFVWRFRYNAQSASAYKWEFVGGSPATVQGVAGNTTSASWTYLGAGVSIPRAGDYEIVFGGNLSRSTATEWLYVSLLVGNGAVNTQSISWTRPGSGSEQGLDLAQFGKVGGAAAGSTFRLGLANSNGSSQVNLNAGWFRLTPVRVS